MDMTGCNVSVKKIRASELWNILDGAKTSLEIYALGRNPFNIFCGDVPDRMLRLLQKGVKINAYYPVAKSSALDGAVEELGLSGIKVYCLQNEELAKRSFCLLDGISYIAERALTEMKMAELRFQYPRFNDEEIMEVADDFFEYGGLPDKLALYRAYIERAKMEDAGNG